MDGRSNSIVYRSAVIIAGCMMLLGSYRAAAQQFIIKTNALSFVAGTPSLGIEGVIGERTSVELSFMGHYKPYGYNSRLILCQPELRYWISGRPLTRAFVGVTLAAARYSTDFKQYNYDGYSLVAGVTGGYAFSLGKRWNLELTAGMGIAGFLHDRSALRDNRYVDGDADRYNSWGYKIVPVKLGVNFSYIIR